MFRNNLLYIVFKEFIIIINYKYNIFMLTLLHTNDKNKYTVQYTQYAQYFIDLNNKLIATQILK